MSGLGEHHGDHAVDAADVTLRSGAWPGGECVEPRCLHPAETGAPADPGRDPYLARATVVVNWPLGSSHRPLSIRRRLVHHHDLLEAVVRFGETLGVDWEDG